jgi:hypothetical protein
MLAGLLLTAFPAQAEEPVEHRFFVCGWAGGGPAIYDASFEKVWNFSSDDEISDGWVLPDGGVVFSFSKRKQNIAGVVRLDKDKKELWTYVAPDGNDNHSCQPLSHGGFLLGECGTNALWMVEIDAAGKEQKRIKVAGAPKDKHHAFRMVRKTPQGTYLAALMRYAGELEGGRAYEWDASGKLIHTFPSGSFLAVRLPNGNTLVSDGHGREGHDSLMTEYTPDGEIVWELTGRDLEAAGLSVKMVCGFQRLPSGNTVVSNVRHGKKPHGLADGDSPKLFEITPDKKVVWTAPDSIPSKNTGSVQILDAEGDPFKLEILR